MKPCVSIYQMYSIQYICWNIPSLCPIYGIGSELLIYKPSDRKLKYEEKCKGRQILRGTPVYMCSSLFIFNRADMIRAPHCAGPEAVRQKNYV